MGSASLLVGTSGWSYDHWVDPFYPPGLPSSKRLFHFSQHFRTVEINSSFYHLPSEKTLATWRDTVPKNFVFAAKASRFITHIKRLQDIQSAELFLDLIAILGDRLGPILFQLPPSLKKDLPRLLNFLDFLPANRRFAFEFRHDSWYSADVYDALHRKNAALCIHDLNQKLTPIEVTASFVYRRFHGTVGKYGGKYPRSLLAEWGKRIGGFLRRRLAVYAYFNNDAYGYAVENAKELHHFLEERR